MSSYRRISKIVAVIIHISVVIVMEWTKVCSCIQRGVPCSISFYRHCIHVFTISAICSFFLVRDT